MEIITKSAEETARVGRELSAKLKVGDVLALSGDLGAGKTTFVQGIANGLGIKGRITSPTFIIMRSYEPNFYHVDLYRLEGDIDREIENIGLKDIIKGGESIVVMEWAEKIKDLLPKEARWVKFEDLGDGSRKINIL